MRIAWVTDIHLNFVDNDRIECFCREILRSGADVLLVGGDIGEAASVAAYLDTLATRLQRPIFFVLGNHDYYGGSIAEMRRWAETITRQSPWLRWLPAAACVELAPQTALVGHDGWSDGRFGDFFGSPVRLNDYVQIEELRGLAKPALLARLNQLGDGSATHFQALLPDTLSRYRDVVVLTHVPPFREACRYRGKPSDVNWLPHFTCKAVGDVLREFMADHPECRMTVLCGHTHGAADVRILPNLIVRTGEAEYGRPQVQGVFERGVSASGNIFE